MLSSVELAAPDQCSRSLPMRNEGRSAGHSRSAGAISAILDGARRTRHPLIRANATGLLADWRARVPLDGSGSARGSVDATSPLERLRLERVVGGRDKWRFLSAIGGVDLMPV